MRNAIAAIAALAALLAPALPAAGGAGAAQKPSAGGFSFIVIGDTPYGPEDEKMLEGALDRIKSAEPPFVIHLGDYKGGKAECTPEHDDRYERLIADLAPIPVFATIGDNEWTDCDRNRNTQTGERYSELQRLSALRARFHGGHAAGGKRFEAVRQAALPENETWVFQSVRFATLHVVGTDNGRSYVEGDGLDDAAKAVDAREAANAEWLAEAASRAKSEKARALVIALQADPTDVRRANIGKPCAGASKVEIGCDAFGEFRTRLRAAAADFGGPMLVIHGDTEAFTLNRDFLDGAAPNLWRLNAAGDAGLGSTGFSYGVRDVTDVIFTGDEKSPFRAKGLMTGKIPKAKG